jgi:hypothetical protein
MIKMLYANGDSMTEGSELGNAKFNYDEKKYGPGSYRTAPHMTKEHAEHMETNSYPYVLKKILGIENHINAAMGGSSNRRIVRTTIADVEALLKTYKPEEILVVIGWSAADRFELYNEGHYSQIIPGYAVSSMFSNRKKKIVVYDNLINSEFHEVFIRHTLEIIALKNYLESKGIKHLFCYGLATFFLQQYGEDTIRNEFRMHQELRTFTDLAEFDQWFIPPPIPEVASRAELVLDLPKYSLYSHSHNLGFPRGNGGHPLEEAHKDWAALMAKHIISKGMLK